jgi:hypothetical protein
VDVDSLDAAPYGFEPESGWDLHRHVCRTTRCKKGLGG